MKAASNTFIAFAAAPGDVAYEGANTLSPFSLALAKYMDVVDLPLSNLTSRVRQEVLKLTNGLQRTWDQSSLMAPFFFNPGSSLLFAGNLMALIGVLLSMVPYSLVLSSGKSWTWIAVAGVLPLLSLSILLFGMQSVYSRLRGNFQIGQDKRATVRDHLIVSLQKGSFGGYLGSFIASLGVSIPFYATHRDGFHPPVPLGVVVLEIAVATALIGCVLGFLSLFFSRAQIGPKGFKLTDNPSHMRTIIGSAVGGALAGALVAPILMLYFGRMFRPQMTPTFLLPGGILGASIFIFSIVNFDFERLNRRRLETSALGAIASVLCGALTAAIIFGPLYFLGIVTRVIHWLEINSGDNAIMIAGGVIYGLPVGVILGIVIGVAIILTQWWSGKPVILVNND
jgi:hypothetical protein